eukprot:scaffold1591_cov109-Isochrysis_galbana.AAC.7
MWLPAHLAFAIPKWHCPVERVPRMHNRIARLHIEDQPPFFHPPVALWCGCLHAAGLGVAVLSYPRDGLPALLPPRGEGRTVCDG